MTVSIDLLTVAWALIVVAGAALAVFAFAVFLILRMHAGGRAWERKEFLAMLACMVGIMLMVAPMWWDYAVIAFYRMVL